MHVASHADVPRLAFSQPLCDARYRVTGPCASKTSGFTTDCRPPSCNRGRSRDLSAVLLTCLIGSAWCNRRPLSNRRYISVKKYKVIKRDAERNFWIALLDRATALTRRDDSTRVRSRALNDFCTRVSCVARYNGENFNSGTCDNFKILPVEIRESVLEVKFTL